MSEKEDMTTGTHKSTVAVAPDLVRAVLTAPEQVAQWSSWRLDDVGGSAVDDPITYVDPATGGTIVVRVDPCPAETSITEITLDGASTAAGTVWPAFVSALSAHVDGLLAGAGAKADVETGTVTRSVVVRAGVSKTWTMLTAPAAIERWWGHPTVFGDGLHAGALGTFEWVGHGLFPVRIERFDPPTRMDLRAGGLDEAEPGATASAISFVLTPVTDVLTLVTVVETGLADPDLAARRAKLEDGQEGWTIVLDAFVRFIEADA